MNSITKRPIDEAAIRNLAEVLQEPVDTISNLDDGFYNASYSINCSSGSRYVLKVAPPEDVEILTYEKNIMRTEVAFMEAVAEAIPVPAVIHKDFSRSVINRDWYLMDFLDGRPLNSHEPVSRTARRRIYTALAAHYAAMHRIEGTHFGYPGHEDRFTGLDYPRAFMTMIDMVLEDGKRKNARLPVSEPELRSAINRHLHSFSTVKSPVMVHFDLWDGNLFVNGMKEPESGAGICGIVDFERGFWGDPCADLCHVSLYLDLNADGWFLDAYNAHAEHPIRYEKDEKARTILYRTYLFLIMVVESYYRDVDGSFNGQLEWAGNELCSLVEQLNGM
ncbi:phosphotransferase family protein [Salinispira pacifica]|uniref:Aminoglycoside phosphotransferase domain-containing protein n=1 Tax=Salinispira pacifica TaxID=1307761 RepID=V5WN89_9SPIO|nr:aminoglycoside phosphotransferase family protein [Salinispira pacifica]AHC16679.1 hypothetical protein L21SP2_3341 [Salinispira pacifica]